MTTDSTGLPSQKEQRILARFIAGFDILNLGRENEKGLSHAEPFSIARKPQGQQLNLTRRLSILKCSRTTTSTLDSNGYASTEPVDNPTEMLLNQTESNACDSIPTQAVQGNIDTFWEDEATSRSPP